MADATNGVAISVAVQHGDFDVSAEIAALRGADSRVGAVAAFIGTVRDVNDGAGVAGMIANRIFHQGASLAAFKLEIVLLVTMGVVLLMAPLLVFAPKILAAQRQGLREYGAFTAEYMREFEAKFSK